MKKKKFLDGNGIYVIWFTFYVLLTYFAVSIFVVHIGFAAIITAAIYTVTLSLAFTPTGEKLFKLLNGVRPLYTKREKAKIMPIADDIQCDINSKTRNRFPKIEINISDSLIPNAFAIGENTIVVTKGLIESMTETQIKGILAHEYGHLIHGDTKAVVFTFIGNGVLNITAVVVQKLLRCIISVLDSVSRASGMMGTVITGIFSGTFRIVLFIFEALLFIVQFGGELILKAKYRRNELCADSFAFRMNYGEELVEALYDIELMSSGQTLTIMEQLRASHPHIAKRIGYLEHLIDNNAKQVIGQPR